MDKIPNAMCDAHIFKSVSTSLLVNTSPHRRTLLLRFQAGPWAPLDNIVALFPWEICGCMQNLVKQHSLYLIFLKGYL